MNQKTTALIIVGIAAIMLFAINCSGSSPSDTPPEPEPDPVCECTDKEHLGIGETCCDLEDCTCTLRVYGEINDNTYGNHFKIYRNGDVTDAEMATAAANIIAGYGNLAEGQKIDLAGKIDEVHVITDPNYTYTNTDGKLIAGIKFDRSQSQIRNRFASISDGIVTPVIAQIKSEGIREGVTKNVWCSLTDLHQI